MQPYQERVVVERDELSEKLTKLRTFHGGAVFAGLPVVVGTLWGVCGGVAGSVRRG